MSKSLKNFITIRQALEIHTARQMRFCFLLHKYNAPMDYGDNTMAEAVSVEKIFNDFFLNVKVYLRRLGLSGSQHVGVKEQQLFTTLENIKTSVRNALCDDFDTPTVIALLQELIRATNRYMEEPTISSIVLSSVAKYITSILKTFGLVQDSNEIGFPIEAATGSSGSGVSLETTLAPYLDALTNFREAVRLSAFSGDAKAILGHADKLRDEILPDLGVRLEEKGSGGSTVSLWKLDNPETMRLERAQKAEAKAQKEAQKEEQMRKLKEKEEKAKIPPELMYKGNDAASMYSAYNEQGVPTHDAKGEPLSKNMIKKLEKDMEKQREAHQKYLASLEQKK
jgi:cysteinyl-tRNA synthetase